MAILSRGRWVKSIGHDPHIFAHDWLAQDLTVCCTWTSVEQAWHYRTDSTFMTLAGHYVDHSRYTPTELRHRDGCRCLGVKKAPGHQQPPCWLAGADRTVGSSCADFPVDDFCKLVRLMDTGRNQNLLCVLESESCPLIIRAYFDAIR